MADSGEDTLLAVLHNFHDCNTSLPVYGRLVLLYSTIHMANNDKIIVHIQYVPYNISNNYISIIYEEE